MQSDSYATSAHEAGHALTAYLCGGEAWIERKGNCGARIPDDQESDDRWVIAHMLVDAAGLAGEALLCGFDPNAQLAAGGDQEEFVAGCKALRAMGSPFVASSDGLTWEWYVQAAKVLLAHHDRVLADLADQLEHNGSLDRGTVARRISWWGVRPIFDTAWKSALVDLLEDSFEALQASADAQALARRWTSPRRA
jgi:hypothetical protein